MAETKGDAKMHHDLKPISVLLKISLILHIASLCIIFVLYHSQIVLLHWFNSVPGRNVSFYSLPPIAFASIIAIFILHCALTIKLFAIIKRENNNLNQLCSNSIFSIIFAYIMAPIISRLDVVVNMYILNQATPDERDIFVSLRHMMNYGLSIRDIALTILLIAGALAIYYSYIKRKGQ